MADPDRITGFCPMGCGTTLTLVAGGHIECTLIGCPDPDAVSTLLADRETEHIVSFGPDTFTVRHPLRERIGDVLMECELHQYIADLSGPPVAPGRYRAYQNGHRWTFAPPTTDIGSGGRG